jgi:transcriptional regulator with XRE-family HTH domain
MNDFSSEQNNFVDRDESHFSSTENSGEVVHLDKTKLKIAENYDDSIRRVLSSYDIGQKLRHLRLRKKIALVDLGKHTGLSASMLSQLENGKLIPTLPTLARIAMVFDVGMDFFFGEKRSKRVFSIVRAKERFRFPELSDTPVPGYYFEVLAYGAVDKSMSAYVAEFQQLEAAAASQHSHDGAEFIHVLEGVLAINYQSEEYILETGDSVYFDSSETHSYHGKSDPPAKAIVITVPPRL